jgi:hypothetical protein
MVAEKFIDSQDMNVNFGFSKRQIQKEKGMFRYGGEGSRQQNIRSNSRASRVRDSLNLPSKDDVSKSKYAT